MSEKEIRIVLDCEGRVQNLYAGKYILLATAWKPLSFEKIKNNNRKINILLNGDYKGSIFIK